VIHFRFPSQFHLGSWFWCFVFTTLCV
jgi:hypothetical protein